MTISEATLHWMDEHDRPLGYLARQCGMDAERLISLITGHSAPTNEELAVLASAVEVEADELAHSDASPALGDTHPLRCYTVREVAALLGVSTDTVRKEMDRGALGYIVVGERAMRIPHAELQRRVTL